MTTKQIVAITDVGPLGRALAAFLVAHGYYVAIYHIEDMQLFADIIVNDLGVEHVHAFVINNQAWDSLQSAIDSTKERFGEYPSHAVIYCEEWRSGGPLYLGGWDDKGVYRKVALVNFETVYRALRTFLPSMVERSTGSIVVVGSCFADRPWMGVGAAAYVATKAASAALVQTTAQEVSGHGVRVNAIQLTVLDEPESRDGLPNFYHRTWVKPESAAKVIGFLLSEDAKDVTGATIPVYGLATKK